MRPASNPARPPYATVLLQFFGSRLLILIIAYLGLSILERPDTGELSASPLEWFFKWDATWYVSVADMGYQFHADRQSNVVFLPLFPLLMKIVSFSGLSLPAAGYLVSNVCFALAGIHLWKLARLDSTNDRAPTLATLFLFFGPVSFFFSIVYSEATFLLFLVLSLYHARLGRWIVAGGFAYLAALTRSVGLLIGLALVIEFWVQRRHDFSVRRGRDWLSLAACGMPALGTLTYMAYLGWQVGEPLAYRKAEVHWGREFTWVWDTFTNVHARNLGSFHRAWFFSTAVIALLLVILAIKQRLRASYVALSAAYLLLYTSVNLLEALPRYLSVVAPLYLVVARFLDERPNFAMIATAFTAALLTLSTILFVSGYWFT